MWHEARRQERKIRGMLVDYRRRAERRRDFYEKIKADPTQFLQLHGRPCKIHLDSAVAYAADTPTTMMPWQGNADNLIDRFDVRAHLDLIPPIRPHDEGELAYEERQCNYERYRILAQNVFLGMTEEKFLRQLHLEEQFGYTADTDKDRKRKGTAIGLNYDDPSNAKDLVRTEKESTDSEETDSDLDVDLCIDVSKVEQSQAHELNKCGHQFGMCSNDFYSFLTNDMEEAENLRLAREEEHEKALFSGRKSRRERRAHREKRLANRVLSPPSYAARNSPTYPAFRESKSNSKSPSPVNTGQITYITSFGDDEEPSTSHSKPTYADKVKYGKKTDVSKRKSSDASRSSKHERYKRRRSSDSDRDRRYRRRHSPRYSSHRNKYRHRSGVSRPSSDLSRSRHRRSSPHSHSSRYRSRRRSSRDRHRRTHRSPSPPSRLPASVPTEPTVVKPCTKTPPRKSPSKSPCKSSDSSVPKEIEEPPLPVQRYYGRNAADKSSSSELSSEDEAPQVTVSPVSSDKNSVGNSGTSLKLSIPVPKMTPQDRLKKKMQSLLNKQYKADKIAEQIRSERVQQEQRNREDELREMALKLRRRQRERRHAYDDNGSNRSSETESSPNQPGVKSSPSPPSPRRTQREELQKHREKRAYRNASPPGADNRNNYEELKHLETEEAKRLKPSLVDY